MNEKVAVVTGASRGIGQGVARALGGKGYTVYVTGRGGSGGALETSAQAVTDHGGRGIAVACDHGDDAQVAALFDRIGREAGTVHLLLNNAAAVYAQELIAPGPFWEKPLRLVDMLNVGLRSNYVASYHAAPLMIRNGGGGLIAHISFYGAVSYFHGPAYGAAKAGTDKMAFDMAVDFRPHQVAVISIWPGFVRTDQLAAIPVEFLPPDIKALLPQFETPEFTGLVLDAVLHDPERMKLSGQALIGAELGVRYGIRDLDGKQPISFGETMGRPHQAFVAKA